MALKPGDSKARDAESQQPRLFPLLRLPLPLSRHVSFVKVLGGTLRVASRRVEFFALALLVCSCMMMGTFCGFYV